MTSSNTLFQLNHSSDNFRHSRRRWVPKGVMLLVVLFVVGLLSACENSSTNETLAEIAVPAIHDANPTVGAPQGHLLARPLAVHPKGTSLLGPSDQVGAQAARRPAAIGFP